MISKLSFYYATLHLLDIHNIVKDDDQEQEESSSSEEEEEESSSEEESEVEEMSPREKVLQRIEVK